MRLDEEDKAYLWDIVEAIKDILAFIENTEYSDFDNDKMKRFAVERQLLVIGEAANHLSEKIKKSIISVPWSQMIGLRNIIAHEYGEILTERIWRIIKNDIISVREELEKYL